MTKLSLRPGADVLFRGRLFTIIAYLDTQFVIARDQADGTTERLEIQYLAPAVNADPSDSPPDLDLVGITDTEWAQAQNRFEVIRPLLLSDEAGWLGREAVEERAAERGFHAATVYRWLRRYEDGARRLSALIPVRRSGGRGKGRLPEEVEAVVKAVMREEYLTSQRKSIADVMTELRARCAAYGFRAPAEATVSRRIRAINAERKVRAQEGARAAEEAFAPQRGSTLRADTPLALAQIDHTLLDVMVVDEVERKPINRPWITVLLDVFSRMVLGFYVSLEVPGAAGTGLCIAHALLAKEDWLAKRGIGGVGPCWSAPTIILADNAKEFRGRALEHGCMEWGIHMKWRPVKKPEYGAHIERLMGTIADEIHALPGTTRSNPVARGDYDSAKQAVFTLRELEAYLATGSRPSTTSGRTAASAAGSRRRCGRRGSAARASGLGRDCRTASWTRRGCGSRSCRTRPVPSSSPAW